DVPEALVAVIEKMMAKDPTKRHQSPAEVADALAPFAETPIGPPPEDEMPRLSPAAMGGPESIPRSPVPTGRVAPSGSGRRARRPPSSRPPGELPANGPRSARLQRPASSGARTPALQLDSSLAARTPGPSSKPTEADRDAGHFATDSAARHLRE